MSMYENIRRHRRYPFFATAIVKKTNKRGTSQLTTLVNNISEGGLGVYAYSPIEKETPVSIELIFKSIDGSKKKDIIKGNIAWLANEGNLYIMGISFDDELNPYKHPNIYSYFTKSIKRD